MPYKVKKRYYDSEDQFGEAYIIISDNAEPNTNIEEGEYVRLVPVDMSHLEGIRGAVRCLLLPFSDRISDDEIDAWFTAALDGFNNTNPKTGYMIDNVPMFGMMVPNLVSLACANLLDHLEAEGSLTGQEKSDVKSLTKSFREHASPLFKNKEDFLSEN